MGCFIFGGGGKKADGDNLNFSQVNMEPQFGLAGKKFYNRNKELKTGTILNWDGTPLTLMDGDTIPGADVVEPSLTTRYIPSGKYLGKPVELAPMARGFVDCAQLDDHTFRITKTAGYIEGGTQDFAILGREIDYFTVSSVASRYDRFSVYAEAPNVLEKLSNMFAVNIIATSASSGQVAAASFAKGGDGGWTANVYVIGGGYLSPNVELYMGPEGQYYVRFDITVKDFNGFSPTAVYTGRCWYWH